MTKSADFSQSNLRTVPDNEALQNYFNKSASTYRDQTQKADGGKLRLELIPTSAIVSIGRLLTHGATKYGPNTWQDVEWDRYLGALLRHLVAFMDDPTGTDADSGLPHVEHLLINAVFLNDAVHKNKIQPK